MELISRDEVMRLAESGRLLSGSFGERAKDIIDSLPTIEERKWIAVSEQLPLDDSFVLVTRKGEGGYSPNTYYLDIARYYEESRKWTQDWESIGDAQSKVIAWVPLPEPWKGE